MSYRKTLSSFLKYLDYFLNTYMVEVKGLSLNTVKSYKTTFKLLITFMYTEHATPADELEFITLDANMLSAFLKWLETDRHCSPSTRNQRLAALYSFSEYAQNRDFEAASSFRTSVLAIPNKRIPKKKRVSFTTDEIKIFLAVPGQNSEIAVRDTLLLSVMYATGSRAQEICDLKVKKISFSDTNTTIDLIGKGKKARRVRIPNHCAVILKKYLVHKKISNKPNHYVFSSQTHDYMTVSCVEAIYKKYVKQAKLLYPNLFQEKSYSPHCMRHTTAQHMLEAGVPIMVIKSFLGHASVQTTQIYIESTQAAIDKHVKEWNERNFPKELYPVQNTSKPDEIIPSFLKNN
ncbi:tyrosine-type recombinase/integrase [Petrocella sp. FN5]|uniref:tyrosine-type recombinase/integrase n=1 Tax=Petrocella sp. FN5 TaxID=3032002 RepID=UPI0023DAEA64|nr:tyrosine-type recombinase/integrase [Petrocella sp. FN5]MDF1618723.1 tyrosine-type recombinase/integrase [Petrocella sp. FN5]